MDVEILDKKDNPLLDRTEVQFQISHAGEKTPQRSAVRDKIAAATGAKTNAVVVTRMRSRFGQPITLGAAKVYKSADAARATERPYLLKRNALWTEKEGEAPEPTEEEAPPPPPSKKQESEEEPSEKDEADKKESKADASEDKKKSDDEKDEG